MPVHVGFQVVQVTGLNEYDIPKELLVTKEWVSENNDDIHKDPEKVNFQSLGEVIFKDRREDVGKHELKTIYIESDVTFLKFQIGQNYENQKTNPYDQVGLVNIAVLGRPVPSGYTAVVGDGLKQETKMMKGMSLLQRYNTSDVKRDDYPPDMLDLLVVIEKNKEAAVKNENYALATKCKKASKELSTAMSALKDKEDEKRVAVEKEDYEQAELLTKEIQGLRTTTLKKIDPKVLEEQNILSDRLLPLSRDSTRDTPTPKPLFERIALTPSPPRSREKKRKTVHDDSILSRELTPPPPSVTPTPSTRPPSRSRLPRSMSMSTVPSNNNKFMQKENTIVPGATRR
uniref:UVR domain-containing protein n=1 Tax=Steinernema glaseri TaxID=37863 RepID=A0A1I8A6L4_9BILA